VRPGALSVKERRPFYKARPVSYLLKIVKTIQSIAIFLFLGCLLAGCAQKAVTPTPTSAAPAETPAATATSPDPQYFLSEGQKAYRRGDYAKAIFYLEAGLVLETAAPPPWPRFLLYSSYLSVGDYPNALALATALVNEKPLESLAYLQMGLAQLWSANAKGAVKSFAKALEFESHSPRVWFYKGLAHRQLKQTREMDRAFGEAEKEYRQILNTNPKDFTASYEYASLLLFLDKEVERAGLLLKNCSENVNQNAKEDLSQDVALYKNYYLPFADGILMFRRNDYKASITSLFRALDQAPSGVRADRAEIYYYLGQNYLRLNEPARAKGFFTKGALSDPNGIFATEMQKTSRKIASPESTDL